MKNKVIYGGAAAVTLAGCVFSESELIRFLLAYELLLIPVLLLLTKELKRKLDVTVYIPEHYVQKGQEFAVEIRLRNRSVLPVPSVFVKLCLENEFTGKNFFCEDTVMVRAKGESALVFNLKAGYCGKVLASPAGAWVQDYLRLFSGKLTDSGIAGQEEEIMVLPVIRRIEIAPAWAARNNKDGETYSHTKSGDDTSEVFDVRSYRAGDTMQRVHWKLTAKTNEFLVKEYSILNEQTVLLFLDLYCERQKEFTQEMLDSFLEVLASLSWSLQESGWQHRIIWYDVSGECVKETVIASEKDVYMMLEQICGAGVCGREQKIRELYFEQYGGEEAAKDAAKEAAKDAAESLTLDVTGRFFRGDLCVKQFGQEDLEKELMEWKLEI